MGVESLALAALVKKAVDTAKYALAGDLNAVVTQIVAWAAGIGAVALAAASEVGDQMMVLGQSLHSLSGWTQVLIGLNVASIGGIGWDFIKAFDNSNSAVVPDLLGRVTHTTAPPPEHQHPQGPSATV